MSKDCTEYSARYGRDFHSGEFARQYAENYGGRLTLRRIPTRVIAIREVSCVAAALKRCRPGLRRILDAPCGTGKLTALLSGHAHEQLTGCDLSREMLRLARHSNGPAAERKVCLAQADATALPYANGSFDCVVCLRLLHLVPAPVRQEIIKELARVSSQYLIVSFGVDTAWQRFLLRVRRLMTKSVNCPYPAGRQEIGELAALNGLTVRRVWWVVPGLLAEALMLLEKRMPGAEGPGHR
jgi:SAM-dependent methyltransferase